MPVFYFTNLAYIFDLPKCFGVKTRKIPKCFGAKTRKIPKCFEITNWQDVVRCGFIGGFTRTWESNNLLKNKGLKLSLARISLRCKAFGLEDYTQNCSRSKFRKTFRMRKILLSSLPFHSFPLSMRNLFRTFTPR